MNLAMGHPKMYRSTARFLLPWVSLVLVLGGAIAVGYAGLALVYAQAFQLIELRRFEHKSPLTEPHLLNLGEVIGKIQIPRLGVEAIIVQGDALELLDRAVGHVPQTALPGEGGNVALAGHRDRLFRPLRHIRNGDIVVLETFAGTFSYEVESTFVVPATEVGVLRSSGSNELTLITCFPFDYVGHAPNRFIVKGRIVAPAGK